MPKQNKRLTRAEKVALSKITGTHKTSAEIGADQSVIDALVDRGYVARFQTVGPAQYQITEQGQDFLDKKVAA